MARDRPALTTFCPAGAGSGGGGRAPACPQERDDQARVGPSNGEGAGGRTQVPVATLTPREGKSARGRLLPLASAEEGDGDGPHTTRPPRVASGPVPPAGPPRPVRPLRRGLPGPRPRARRPLRPPLCQSLGPSGFGARRRLRPGPTRRGPTRLQSRSAPSLPAGGSPELPRVTVPATRPLPGLGSNPAPGGSSCFRRTGRADGPLRTQGETGVPEGKEERSRDGPAWGVRGREVRRKETDGEHGACGQGRTAKISLKMSKIVTPPHLCGLSVDCTLLNYKSLAL